MRTEFYKKNPVQMSLHSILTTSHLALIPQAPLQGSPHFCWIQALLGGHSALITHSGLQLGGGPIYPGKQEQAS